MIWKPGNPGCECCENCLIYEGYVDDADWSNVGTGTVSGTVVPDGAILENSNAFAAGEEGIKIRVFLAEQNGYPFTFKIEAGSAWAQFRFYEVSTGYGPEKRVEIETHTGLKESTSYYVGLQDSTYFEFEISQFEHSSDLVLCARVSTSPSLFVPAIFRVSEFLSSMPVASGDKVKLFVIDQEVTLGHVLIERTESPTYADCVLPCLPLCKTYCDGTEATGIVATYSGFPATAEYIRYVPDTPGRWERYVYEGADAFNGTHTFPRKTNPEYSWTGTCWVDRYKNVGAGKIKSWLVFQHTKFPVPTWSASPDIETNINWYIDLDKGIEAAEMALSGLLQLSPIWGGTFDNLATLFLHPWFQFVYAPGISTQPATPTGSSCSRKTTTVSGPENPHKRMTEWIGATIEADYTF